MTSYNTILASVEFYLIRKRTWKETYEGKFLLKSSLVCITRKDLKNKSVIAALIFDFKDFFWLLEQFW